MMAPLSKIDEVNTDVHKGYSLSATENPFHSRKLQNAKAYAFKNMIATYISPALREKSLAVQFTLSSLAPTLGPEAQVTLPRQPTHGLLRPRVVLHSHLPPQVRADLVRRDPLLVLVDNRSSERTLLDQNRRQNEARTP